LPQTAAALTATAEEERSMKKLIFRTKTEAAAGFYRRPSLYGGFSCQVVVFVFSRFFGSNPPPSSGESSANLASGCILLRDKDDKNRLPRPFLAHRRAPAIQGSPGVLPNLSVAGDQPHETRPLAPGMATDGHG
jgi:hypothetical protein